MKEYIIDHPVIALIVRGRNSLLRGMYILLLKPILFRFDPEKVHDMFVAIGSMLGKSRLMRVAVHGSCYFSHTRLRQTVCGIVFTNPIGLGAGFDKNGMLTDILPSVGFGFEEIGSITGRPCAGNRKPRLWRLKKSQSILVHYGLVNEGASHIGKRLSGKSFHIPIGTSIAKTNSRDTAGDAEGIADYVKAFRRFVGIGDYFTINISCPNAYGGQPFHDEARLDALLEKLDAIDTKKPLFLKISPDLTKAQVDAVIDVACKHRVHGLIISNLTKSRDNEFIRDPIPADIGGMSGKVVQGLSDELLRYVYTKAQGRLVLVGCGGVFSAEDAYRKIRNGAALVQIVTGLIFRGPTVVSEINEGLIRLMKRDGYENIAEVVGVDCPRISQV